ncbi:hypothetical protein CBR_g6325 [Chara braunii]|uniref:Ribosome-recycling factor, chloroplastic n=1 Tax=Chara braunii TaxID=69332 RepID=A0A388KJG5_CHABU|nr:hypothetical protein CBR_g6325 [Chara braunii]|eukprot:GBG70194.1 hypothetical protein CBR_g6325 [Chara braunii]
MISLCRSRASGLTRLTARISNGGEAVANQSFNEGSCFGNVSAPSERDLVNQGQSVSSGIHPLLARRYFARLIRPVPANPQWNALPASPSHAGHREYCSFLHRGKPSDVNPNSIQRQFCNDRRMGLSSVTPSCWCSSAKKSDMWDFVQLRAYAKKAKTKKARGKGGGKHDRVDSDSEGDDEDEDEDKHGQQLGRRSGSKADGVVHGHQAEGRPVKTVRCQMVEVIDAFTEELAQLRTGRASPSLLSHINVRYGGDGTFPLNTIAAVTVRDPQTLGVLVYDRNMIDAVEKAIMDSPSGLFPKRTEDGCLVPLPRMTEEVREVVAKEAARASENAKVRLRRVRKDGLAMLKKDSEGMSEDDTKRQEKEIEEVTKDFVNHVATLSRAKEKEILHG